MPDTREVPVSPFFHQIDKSGLFHSICCVCYQTVAKEARESRLLRGEENHLCLGALKSQ
jgi:hypothetical protein